MIDDLTFGIVFVATVYILAKVMNHSARAKEMRSQEAQEKARLRRIASLYGREYNDYPSKDEEL